MKTGICALLLILWSGVCHCQHADGCSMKDRVKDDIYFPDISNMTDGSYQMAVEMTVSGQSRSEYFVEYFDTAEKRGRVDVLDGGKTTKYYYYSDGMEAFEISESDFTCKELNETYTPDFERYGMYNWRYTDSKLLIHGPSAMFKETYELDKRNHSQVAYMGNAAPIRGIPAQFWRRCLQKNLTVDYYFSTGKREGVYGLKDLTQIPLRVEIYGVDKEIPEASKELLPQNYEIMSYTPFLEDPFFTFELPAGLGCGRKSRESDNEIPSFEGQNLYVRAEVIFTDYGVGGGMSYSSNFIYAYDIAADYSSYFYTPWIQTGGKMVAGDSVYVVYDVKNKYVFSTTYSDGKCNVGGLDKYIPSYSLPGNRGYVSLTDSSMFYPNDEFHYLGEAKDRGYDVEMYEVSYPDGYPLGDKVVKNTVITHYYLKESTVKVGPRATESAMTRIRMRFNGTDEDGRMLNAVLNFNFHTFSTGVDFKARNFYIEHCFRDADDIMSVTIGFSADESDLELIKEDLPSVVENARTYLIQVADVPPARLPHVTVDFTDSLYVTFIVLERAPFQLDFSIPPQENTVISNPSETHGITFLNECAYKCLENELDCWGFAYCGATCYIGAAEKSKSKLEPRTNCTYYNRTNFGIVPRLKVVRRNLESSVEKRMPRLAVAKKGGGVIEFKPTFIGNAVSVESQEMFDRFGMETSRRLRVVKPSQKLKSGTAEDIGKKFGSLTYGECQSFCLDYQACETVSYCISTNECILSLTQAEDIPATSFVEDSFCTVLTRKYADSFIRSPGIVLSERARKILDISSDEDCAKACVKETSFNCLSFDNCPAAEGKNGCRLHSVHTLSMENDENAVTKEKVCGHYSKKYTYDFKRESKKRTLGNGVVVSSGSTIEQCARGCVDYNQGQCYGFDLCQGKDLKTTCIVITQQTSDMKTTYSAECTHFSRTIPEISGSKAAVTSAVAGGVGFLLFVIGCVLGALVVYGIAYYRVNRSQ